MNHITLVPYAGLCNRLRAILSAIAYHEKTGVPVSIYWEKTRDCRADFDELFQEIEGYPINRLDSFILKPACRRNLRIPALLRLFKFRFSYEGSDIRADEHLLFDELKGNVYISSNNRFCPLEINTSLAGLFKPVPEIQKIIDNTCRCFSDSTIGIHIRRTDNIASIRNSPLEKFYTTMDAEIENDNNVTFFLATDDDNVKREMVERYGSRIVTYDSSLSRSTLEGMKDAVVELYCLGNTSRIIGSLWSTYSIVASQLYDIDLKIIQ